MSEAVIALGSNMGNRIENINSAVRAIAKLPHVKIVKASSVYETDPVGKEDQERFYNAALLIKTDISPAMLLGGCLGIEAAMGRVRTEKNGPRIIDLDLTRGRSREPLCLLRCSTFTPRAGRRVCSSARISGIWGLTALTRPKKR